MKKSFRSLFMNRLTAAMLLVGALALSSTAQQPEHQDAKVSQVSHSLALPMLHGGSGGCDGCGGCDGPDQCVQKHCVASVEEKTVEKHCWNVESEDICVPKVVLPWQAGGSGLTIFRFLNKKSCSHGCTERGCDGGCDSGSCGSCETGCCPKPRCGKVITVCVLEKEKYEDTKCVCKWEIRESPCACCQGFACDEALVEDCDGQGDNMIYLHQSSTTPASKAAAEVHVARLPWQSNVNATTQPK